MTRRTINRMNSVVFGWIAAVAVSRSGTAGPVPRIVHTVHGTVLAIDTLACSLTVKARRLEAWMGAITTVYRTDNQKLLREVKVGDQIMAEVYDGETALHHVEIVAVAARPAPEG
jgi:Cu/Ag efflux protein CusF